MKLTKKQLKIVDELNNGGFIWASGSFIYLSKVEGKAADGSPRFSSTPLHKKTFYAIEDLLTHKDGRWTIG